MYGVLPISIAFLAAFNAVAGRMPRKRLFNSIVAAFMVYIAAFAFLMLPHAAALHPHAAAEAWLAALPPGVAGGVAVVRNWSFSLFYCASEMWGDICLSLLFWSLANETTSIADAAVLYPLFGIGANMAQVVAGQCLKAVGGVSAGVGGFEAQFQSLTLIMLAFGAAIVALHEYVSRTASFRADALNGDAPTPEPTEDTAPADRTAPASSEDHGAPPAALSERQAGAVSTSGRGAEARVTPPWAGARESSRFVARALRGERVVMQVIDNHCLCVRMAAEPAATIMELHGTDTAFRAARGSLRLTKDEVVATSKSVAREVARKAMRGELDESDSGAAGLGRYDRRPAATNGASAEHEEAAPSREVNQDGGVEVNGAAAVAPVAASSEQTEQRPAPRAADSDDSKRATAEKKMAQGLSLKDAMRCGLHLGPWYAAARACTRRTATTHHSINARGTAQVLLGDAERAVPGHDGGGAGPLQQPARVCLENTPSGALPHVGRIHLVPRRRRQRHRRSAPPPPILHQN